MYRVLDISRTKHMVKVLDTEDNVVDTVSFYDLTEGRFAGTDIKGLVRNGNMCSVATNYDYSLISYSNTRTLGNGRKLFFTVRQNEGLHIYYGDDSKSVGIYKAFFQMDSRPTLRVSKVFEICGRYVYQVIIRYGRNAVTLVMSTYQDTGRSTALHKSRGIKLMYLYDNVVEVAEKTAEGNIVQIEKIYL